MSENLCRHCSEPLDAHVDAHPPGSLVPNARCCGIKRYFEAEAIAPPLSADDLERIEREKMDTEPSGPPSERVTMPELRATEAVTLPPPEVD